MAAFQKEVPAYAFYPNLAWQGEGYSDLKQQLSRAYESGGVQRWHQPVVRRFDEAMRDFLSKRAEEAADDGK